MHAGRAHVIPRIAVAAALALSATLAACPAAAQPWARWAVADSALGAAVRGSGGGYEAAWNALLVAELRAKLANVDSARALFDLATRVAHAEPAALGSRIGPDALALRTTWTRAQWRERVSAAVAESLGNAAEAARNAGLADSLYGVALARYGKLGEKRRHAWVLGSMGRNASSAGDQAYADSLYRRALAERRALNDPRMIGAAVNSLGSIAYQRGQFADARTWLEEAKTIREGTGERGPLAVTLNYLGLAYAALGDPAAARKSFDGSLQLASALGDSARTLDALVNLILTENRSGGLAAVLALEPRALALARERKNPEREVQILINVAQALSQAGRFTDARERLETGAALEGLGPPSRIDLLNELGRLLVRLGDTRAAAAPLDHALALADSLGDGARRAQALVNLAIAAQLDGDLTGSERLATGALESATASGDSGRVHASLVTLGELARARGDAAAAERAFARATAIGAALGTEAESADLNNWAIATLERGGATKLDEAERRFGEARDLARKAEAPIGVATALLGLGEVAERRGDYAKALEYGRAAASVVDTTRGRLGAGREAVALSSRWRFAFDALIHLLMKRDAREPGKGHASEAFHWAERARARALLERLAQGGAAAEPFTLDQARALITEKDVALLEYSSGDSSTALWVVTARGEKHYVLASRRALGTRIELLRRGLADPARAESKGTLVAARTLWEQLVAPALGDLKGVKRVIVSPDGPLSLLPFEALLAAAPPEGAAPKADAWLGSRWAVSYAFSAATLAARRGRGAGDAIVAVANPDFGGALPALPNTAAEAAALRELAGSRLPSLEILEGANATRARLLALPALPRASVLHIATHGEANEVEPERSGLWLAPDSTGGKPGFLSVADVTAMKLDADLVTLSACETGLGRIERGEGVVGLTRAFVAAGARSVVVSLWKVNDQASADLMRRFYEGALKKHLPRDEALARARRALLQSSATRSPFYWAPFVLVGEAGKIE